MTREIDLVEEVARVVLDRVPLTMPLRRAVAGHLTREQRLRRLVEDVLVGAGLQRGVHVEPRRGGPAPRCDPAAGSDERRPGDPPHDARSTGSSRAAAVNVDAGNDDIALFELARVYLPTRRAAPGGALARRRHRRRAASLPRGARSRRSTTRCTSSSGRRERRRRSSIPARRRRRMPAGSASSIRRCSRARGGCSSSISSS